MRFVPIKSSEQLAILALHRAWQGFIKARTAQANQIRGLLAEYGFILPQVIIHIGKHVPELLEDSENGLSETFRHGVVAQISCNCAASPAQASTLPSTRRWARSCVPWDTSGGTYSFRRVRLPLVEGGRADAMLVAVPRGWLDDSDDLGIAKRWCFYEEPPAFTVRENFIYEHLNFSRGLPLSSRISVKIRKLQCNNKLIIN